jgi:hypothetical protein
VSEDSGKHWLDYSSSVNTGWQKVGFSADGEVILDEPYELWNYSAADALVRRSAAEHSEAASSSVDGQKRVVAVKGGYIYTSGDEGKTWIEHTEKGARSAAAPPTG